MRACRGGPASDAIPIPLHEIYHTNSELHIMLYTTQMRCRSFPEVIGGRYLERSEGSEAREAPRLLARGPRQRRQTASPLLGHIAEEGLALHPRERRLV